MRKDRKLFFSPIAHLLAHYILSSEKAMSVAWPPLVEKEKETKGEREQKKRK